VTRKIDGISIAVKLDYSMANGLADKFGTGHVDSTEKSGALRTFPPCRLRPIERVSKRGAAMPAWVEANRIARRLCPVACMLAAMPGLGGCHLVPVEAKVQGDLSANVTAATMVGGSLEIKTPTAVDPGEMTATVVRPGNPHAICARIALIDVDGLLLNQNFGSQMQVADNPLSAFRDKLEAAARDPQVAAVVLRINSPGGSVTTCDIMAEELRRFRTETHKPVVACLMDLATSGAYLVAAECDRIIAHPTTVTAGLGVVFNHYNLKDMMATNNVVADPVKSGAKVDMGTVTAPLEKETRQLLQQMVDAYRDHLLRRVRECRPAMNAADNKAVEDGRVLLATNAQACHLVDQIGYLHHAIADAEHVGGVSNAEVILYHRSGYPTHSRYAITPIPAPLSEAFPLSYPGFDRSKLPAFLYLWQSDPTSSRLGSH
jgi:protease-4